MNCSRRELLEKMVLGVAAIPMAGMLAACGKKEEVPAEPVQPAAAPAAPAPETLVVADEADPQAQAIGYKADGAQVDVTKLPNQPPAGTTPRCTNCQLGQSINDPEWMKCTVLVGKKVKSAGLCNTWSLKIA